MMTLVNMCAMMVPIISPGGGRPTVGTQGQAASSPDVHPIMLNLGVIGQYNFDYKIQKGNL